MDTEGVWVWSDGTPSPWEFESWSAGQPDNSQGDQNANYINYKSTGLWDDGHPTAAISFICQYNEDADNDTDTWRLVKINSETATTTYDLYSAIMSGVTVAGQTEVLYRPGVKGWQEDSVYSWTVRHQPSLSSLAISVDRDGELLWGHHWPHTFTQPRHLGQVGVFTHSQRARFYNLTVQPLCL